jgi:hypothetical protein
VLVLASPEVVCTADIKKLSSIGDHVYDFGAIHFLGKNNFIFIIIEKFSQAYKWRI